MSGNAWRWTGAVALGIGGGLFAYFSDNTHWTGWFDLCRHVILTLGPTLGALKLTLTPAK
jgi:hypothetical protein